MASIGAAAGAGAASRCTTSTALPSPATTAPPCSTSRCTLLHAPRTAASSPRHQQHLCPQRSRWVGSSKGSACAAPVAPCRPHPALRTCRPDVSAAGVRRSPVITPDVVVGKGEDEVRARGGMQAGRTRLALLPVACSCPLMGAWQAWACGLPCATRPDGHAGAVPCHAHPLAHRTLRAQTSIDLFNYLLRQRIIFLAGYVNDKVRGPPPAALRRAPARTPAPLHAPALGACLCADGHADSRQPACTRSAG